MSFIEPVIEKGVVKTPKQEVSPKKLEFLRKLEIADSFVINKFLAMQLQAIAKKIGIRLTTQKVNDKEVRVWRIS